MYNYECKLQSMLLIIYIKILPNQNIQWQYSKNDLSIYWDPYAAMMLAVKICSIENYSENNVKITNTNYKIIYAV